MACTRNLSNLRPQNRDPEVDSLKPQTQKLSYPKTLNPKPLNPKP